MRGAHWLLIGFVLGGCYSGARASQGINAAWQGRSVAELEAEWGTPHRAEGNRRHWVLTATHVELPSARAELTLDERGFEAYGEIRPGQQWTTEVGAVTATVDAAGRVVALEGPSIRFGAPPGANLRHGFLLGFHAGMGRLDDTETWLPGGSFYIGGMLGPRTGLVGQFTLASGYDDDGGAMGLAWTMGPQWWPHARVWLRAGPAMVLDWNPGFEDTALRPGLNLAGSYALVRSGAFVLDLRVDGIAHPEGGFGTVGIGVNIN